MSLRMTDDRGALLENLVYMHFRRQGLTPEYYVTKIGAEVDFVLAYGQRR
jgi:predicted AAA+ superfamily ATPase